MADMARATHLISLLLIKLIGILPLSIVRLLGRFFALVSRLSNSKIKRIAARNIQLVRPNIAIEEQQKLASSCLSHSMMTAIEMPLVWQKSNQWLKTKILSVENDQLMRELVDQHNGIIVICPHVGNWEVFGRILPDYGPTTSLYQPPKYHTLESVVRSGREASGASLVPTNQRGIAKLLKALKNGEITGILPDQVPKTSSGQFATFFGLPAYSMTLIYNLIQKTHCKVILGYAIRYQSGFKIIFKPADEEIYSDDIETSLNAMNRMVEQSTEEDFCQYQWTYKRFKKQPDNKSPYSKI
jgi:KDO2-lipid IV(A) lauroyltransferase